MMSIELCVARKYWTTSGHKVRDTITKEGWTSNWFGVFLFLKKLFGFYMGESFIFVPNCKVTVKS